MVAKKKKQLPAVAMGHIIRENLPYPVVYYPNFYGSIFAFAESEDLPVFVCSCSYRALKNLTRLNAMYPITPNSNQLRMAPLDSLNVPDIIASKSLINKEGPISTVSFADGLCHKCNKVVPTLRYCHEMYGTRFKQTYGWYIHLAFFDNGIDPWGLDILPDCPEEFRLEIEQIKQGQQIEISFRNKVENIARQQFGFKNVGEQWTSEVLLYQVVKQIYPTLEILRHYRPNWMEGLELDIYIPEIRLAFEYQGQQHYHPIKHWGREKGLRAVQRRDEMKRELCKNLNIRLIAIKYSDPLTEEYIRSIIR